MAVDMFMKIKGIDGESQDAKRSKDIDVLAWSWGMSQSGTMHTGTGGGSGKVNVQDLSFTKYVDRASTVLMMACAKGTHFDTAELRVRKAGDKPLDYITIKLKNVLITSLSTGGSGGEDRLTENVTLNFSQFEVAYQAQKATGGADGGEVFAKFDIAANKPL
jgi:type VI secretion system secreted protein Hcp